MTLDGWLRILGAAREYHLQQTGDDATAGESHFFWHGGEPLLLPVSYWRDVIALQHKTLGATSARPIPFRNGVQTNLFALAPSYLDLFEQERILVNVSYDGAPGTRVTRNGRPTDDRVIENMHQLRERAISFGAAVVLGGHSKESLVATYERLKSVGARHMLVIPLLPVDHFSDDAAFAISLPQVIEAFKELYRHWWTDPNPIPVLPLTGYQRTAWLMRLNLPTRDFDRSVTEWRLTVDPIGDLYVRPSVYGGEQRVGNLFSQTLSEILQSSPYRETLEQDKLRVARVCDRCDYRLACDTRPVLESPRLQTERACPIAAQMCEFIAAHLSTAEDDQGEDSAPRAFNEIGST